MESSGAFLEHRPSGCFWQENLSETEDQTAADGSVWRLLDVQVSSPQWWVIFLMHFEPKFSVAFVSEESYH